MLFEKYKLWLIAAIGVVVMLILRYVAGQVEDTNWKFTYLAVSTVSGWLAIFAVVAILVKAVKTFFKGLK